MGQHRQTLSLLLLTLAIGLATPALGQVPSELTKTDLTKLKTLDASQWTVLGVRLGDTREAAVKTLQRASNVTVQDDAAAGRIYVYSPAGSKTAVMSVKVVENQVTTINLINAFGDWLHGDTKLLFRAFEDDSLRHKILGREDHREAARGGTKESPSVDVSYAYFKEGILLHYSVLRSEAGKSIEALREMVLIYPARPR